MKSLAIILSLSAAVCAEMVSVTSIQKKNLKTALPENCLLVNAWKDCVKCLKDFKVNAGKCTPVTEPKPKLYKTGFKQYEDRPLWDIVP